MTEIPYTPEEEEELPPDSALIDEPEPEFETLPSGAEDQDPDHADAEQEGTAHSDMRDV